MRTTYNDSSSRGRFLVCATTPDDELYQLDTISRIAPWRKERGYCVCLVHSDGSMSGRFDKGYPKPTIDLAKAVSRFERWAERNGYEVMRNEFADFWGNKDEVA